MLGPCEDGRWGEMMTIGANCPESMNQPPNGRLPLVEGFKHQVRVGAACRSRTDDLLITNQLLYQLS